MTTKTVTAGKVYLNVVEQWLDSLPAATSEEFKNFAQFTPSVIEIWVYAGIIGYPHSFNDLVRWVKMKYKKLDRRGILNSEIEPFTLTLENYVWLLAAEKSKG